MRYRLIRGRPRQSSAGARAGFTLLEALVALVILGTAVSAALGAFGGGLRAAAAVHSHANGVRLAESRLSELELLRSDSLAYYAEAGGREGRFAAPMDRFGWRAQITRVSGTEGLLRAAVVVTWNGGDYRLATEYFRRDLVSGVRWRPR
jgi:prepilin-type N-terminal cleavage/methylation domain-containing protein